MNSSTTGWEGGGEQSIQTVCGLRVFTNTNLPKVKQFIQGQKMFYFY